MYTPRQLTEYRLSIGAIQQTTLLICIYDKTYMFHKNDSFE